MTAQQLLPHRTDCRRKDIEQGSRSARAAAWCDQERLVRKEEVMR